MIEKLVSFLLVVTLIAGCGSAGRKQRAQFRDYVKRGQYDLALQYLEGEDSFKDEKSRLLYYMEKGMVHHLAGQLYQSTLELDKARELAKKLYTVSLSKKAQTAIANDTYDIYYGEKYEVSNIYLYLAINHLLLHQRGRYEAYQVKEAGNVRQVPEKNLTLDEKRRELMAARATVLEWDSYLKSLKSARLGNSVFKNDMAAKVVGAYIHEYVGTRNDLQIALQLYKDAKQLLLQNYNGYQSFNQLNRKFREDFEKLHKLPIGTLKEKYILKTRKQEELIDYLDGKILELTRLIRPRDYNRMVSIHKPKKELVEKYKNKVRPSNVSVVIHQGLIPKKVADKHYYGLLQAMTDPNASSSARAAAEIGHNLLTLFAAQQLGLLPPPNGYSPGKAFVGLNVASVAAMGVAIAFELPKVENRPLGNDVWIALTTPEGKIVAKKKTALVNPMGDIAEEAVSEHAAGLYTRLGLRLALKHVAAIVASYGTYKMLKQKSGDFWAKSAAVLQYTAAGQAIAASEKADTRQWASLPHALKTIDFSVPDGTYLAKSYLIPTGSEPKDTDRPIAQVSLTVDQANPKQIIRVITPR